MLQINNDTPLNVELHPFTDIDGKDYAVVITKATYTITQNSDGQSLVFMDKEAGAASHIQHEDIYNDEPGRSSLSYASDLALIKAGTDVLVSGRAYAPAGYESREVQVSVSVNDYQAQLTVFGPRHWEKHLAAWHISQPEYFESIPLAYENAYGGGYHAVNNIECGYHFEPNPVGKGFFCEQKQLMDGLALPNLENPLQRIQTPEDRPLPISFSPIARDWQPRLGFAGTYDDQWQQDRMPLLPLDFNHQFFSCAHSSLRFESYLTGDERIYIKNMSESGDVSFDLPRVRVSVEASLKNESKVTVAPLDTLHIDVENKEVSMVWRATIACPRAFLYLQSVSVKANTF